MFVDMFLISVVGLSKQLDFKKLFCRWNCIRIVSLQFVWNVAFCSSPRSIRNTQIGVFPFLPTCREIQRMSPVDLMSSRLSISFEPSHTHMF